MKIIKQNSKLILIIILLLFNRLNVVAKDEGYFYSYFIDSLQKELVRKDLKDTFKLDILQSLVREFIHIDINIAEKYCNQIDEIIEKNNNPYWVANAYNTFGLLYWAKSDFTKSLDYFLLAAKLNDSLNNQIGLVRNYGNIGLLNYSTQNFDKAIEYTTKAMKLAEKLKMKKELSLAYGNLGIIYQSTKKYDESLIYHNKSLKLTKEMNDRRGIIRNLSNIAVVYTSRNNFLEALKYYREALDLAYKENDNRSIVLLEGNLGVTYYKIATDSVNKPNQSQRHQYLKLSEEYLLKSIDLAKKLNFTDALFEYYPSLSQTYTELNDFKKAYVFNELYYAIKDSLFNIENNKEINNLQAKFEKQLVEKENLLLKKDNQVKEITIYASIVVILLVLTGLYFLYRNNKITKSLNDQLEEQNRKILDAKNELERLLEIISSKNIELEVKNQELAETNATKDKLFSIISHDLRNPLQAILLNSELLKNFRDKMSGQEQQERINNIMLSSDNLSKLLEDLLLWSRSQMKKIEVNPIEFDLQSLVEVVIKLHSEQARLKHIKLENKIPENLKVIGDMSLINTVFRNLISNGIKFTNNDGVVTIGCLGQSDDFCEIFVEDNGVGIPPDKLDKLFSISTSFTTPGTNNEIGTGLGLILVKEFVEKNNGQISVESQLGKGTIFKIKLPKNQKRIIESN